MKSGTKKFLNNIPRTPLVHPESTMTKSRGVPLGHDPISPCDSRAHRTYYSDALAEGWIVTNTSGAIFLTPNGLTALNAALAKPGVFDDDYRPHGTTTERGNHETWRGAAQDAIDLTQPEAATILGGRSPYAVLGVGRSATWEDVQKAFRGKAKRMHPDHGGEEAEMRRILAAYAVLKERLNADVETAEVQTTGEQKAITVVTATSVDDGFLDDEEPPTPTPEVPPAQEKPTVEDVWLDD